MNTNFLEILFCLKQNSDQHKVYRKKQTLNEGRYVLYKRTLYICSISHTTIVHSINQNNTVDVTPKNSSERSEIYDVIKSLNIERFKELHVSLVS